MNGHHSYGSSRDHWAVYSKNGRLISFGLSRSEAKRLVRGTSNRARQW